MVQAVALKIFILTIQSQGLASRKEENTVIMNEKDEEEYK